MTKIILHSHFRRKPYIIIPILLVLHLSAIIFVSNIGTKGVTYSRTMLSHSNRLINNISVSNLLLHRKKLVKFDSRKISRFNTTVIKSIKCSISKFIISRDRIFPHYHEFINKYIEFRPPPELLS